MVATAAAAAGAPEVAAAAVQRAVSRVTAAIPRHRVVAVWDCWAWAAMASRVSGSSPTTFCNGGSGGNHGSTTGGTYGGGGPARR